MILTRVGCLKSSSSVSEKLLILHARQWTLSCEANDVGWPREEVKFIIFVLLALRTAFWNVSGDTNAVFKTIYPCLKGFLFRLKSLISKDHAILLFLIQARILTANNDSLTQGRQVQVACQEPTLSRRQF